MNRKIKVLQFPGSLSVGGVGSMLMNIYRNIDKEQYHFDFCVVRNNEKEGPFDSEISSNRGEIFEIPQIKQVGIFDYMLAVKRIINENGPYDIVHVHSIFQGIFILLVSKYLGIKKRIYHVHNTQDLSLSRIPFAKTYRSIARFIIKRLSTNYLSCGKDAAEYVYGSKHAEKKAVILNNALDLNQFYAFDLADINKIRDELQIPSGALVVGNAARFVEIKNQQFLINLVSEISKNKDVILLLAGDGDTRKMCEQQAKELGIEKRVRFLGNVSDMPKFYNTLDVFILSSLFEGLPVSSIEAQACGVPCLQADTITTESDMGLQLLDSFNLESSTSIIAEQISKLANKKIIDNKTIQNSLSQKGYNIQSTVGIISEIYSG
jgi:glycosyltransferase EpsF